MRLKGILTLRSCSNIRCLLNTWHIISIGEMVNIMNEAVKKRWKQWKITSHQYILPWRSISVWSQDTFLLILPLELTSHMFLGNFSISMIRLSHSGFYMFPAPSNTMIYIIAKFFSYSFFPSLPGHVIPGSADFLIPFPLILSILLFWSLWHGLLPLILSV